MKQYFLTGTYSEPILFGTGEVFAGKGKGIYLCALEDGRVEILSCLSLLNPSFLAIDEKKRHIYAVNEGKEFQGNYGGGLTDIVFDEQGRMQVLSAFPTGGTDPCHVAVSPDGKFVAVANYADGKVSVFPLDETGAVQDGRILFQHEGHGVNTARQEGPHAHCVLFDGEGGMLINDLGIDTIKAYELRGTQVVPRPERDVTLLPGSGPRSGEWSGDGKHLYVTSELACAVTHLVKTPDGMKEMETVSSLPENESADTICADVHLSPDGRFLYASNRGHDSLTVFALQEDHSPVYLDCIPCGGKTPRNFAIEPQGEYLLAGNQDSDNIVIFRILEDGRLQQTADVSFPTPVCIKFFKEPHNF